MESEDFFGYRMKNRRKELHLTQEQFAEIVNTGKNHISAIEWLFYSNQLFEMQLSTT